MKAVICPTFGPPENLTVDDVDRPTPGPGQVLVEVKAAPVTFPDTLIIEDRYQFKATPPFVPGGEVAGVVAEVGPGVERLTPGARVVGATGLTGAYAQFALAKAEDLRLLPDGVDFAASTGLMYAHGTAWYAIKHRGELQPDETMLVLGAGGNVGLAAVELGKLAGARVIAAASNDEKLALCRERGADDVINYTTENLKQRAKELTDGAGCDVIFDAVGGDYAEPALRAIGWGGRYLVIGFTAGIPAIPLNLTLLKSCQIVGVFLGAMTVKQPELADAILGDLVAFTADGRLNPHVSARYPLSEASTALRSLMDRQAVGKVVIEPGI